MEPETFELLAINAHSPFSEHALDAGNSLIASTVRIYRQDCRNLAESWNRVSLALMQKKEKMDPFTWSEVQRNIDSSERKTKPTRHLDQTIGQLYKDVEKCAQKWNNVEVPSPNIYSVGTNTSTQSTSSVPVSAVPSTVSSESMSNFDLEDAKEGKRVTLPTMTGPSTASLANLSRWHAAAAPSLNLTGSVSITDNTLERCGDIFFDIFRGHWFTDKVSLRLIHYIKTSNRADPQKFIDELTRWKALEHPNVDIIYGTVITTTDVYYVSNCMHLNVQEYVAANEIVDRSQFLKEIAAGLKYLHDQNIIHGDLRASNVLVSAGGSAYVTAFGQFELCKTYASRDFMASARAKILRWTAPETIRPIFHNLLTEVWPNQASDVWSYGMTCLEVTTEEQPFADRCSDDALKTITSGRIPLRPSESYLIARGLTIPLWHLLEQCWAYDASARPSMDKITDLWESFDFVVKDVSSLILGVDSVHDVQLHGGFGSIRRAVLSDEKAENRLRPVAVKTLLDRKAREDQTRSIRNTKRFQNEALVWSRLHHQNILEFIGVAESAKHKLPLSLVSPWMVKGNVSDFIRENPSTKRLPLIQGIADGISFLHTNRVVHGDIKGPNVLISEEGTPLLCDFGLAKSCLGQDKQLISTTLQYAGSTRYMAVELFWDGTSTEASDMWAFGITCVEIFNGEAPYHDMNNIQVILKVNDGIVPDRPDSRECSGVVWSFLQECWKKDSKGRPTAADALAILNEQVDEEVLGFAKSSLEGNPIPHII